MRAFELNEIYALKVILFFFFFDDLTVNFCFFQSVVLCYQKTLPEEVVCVLSSGDPFIRDSFQRDSDKQIRFFVSHKSFEGCQGVT